MGKTRGVHETTPELRNRMVGMYEAGLGLRDIAAAVNCSQRTVKRWLNRFDKEGTVETRERCGRKRATTTEEDDAIIRLATQTPLTAAKAVLPALGLNCSVDTIRERLHKAGIHNWSPSRKHMQRIPLGDGDNATIQQAVWRPTGTQLGKKKLVTRESNGESKKPNGSSNTKKKKRSVKNRNRDVEEDAPVDGHKRVADATEFMFSQQNVGQQEITSNLVQGSNNLQVASEALPDNQTQFGSALSLVHSAEPQIYQHHSSMNVAQSWPLDLVQGSHHYPQGQPRSLSHEQPPPQQQLQELHTHREQEHQQQSEQQRMQPHLHPHHLQHHHHHHHHHHHLEQPPPQHPLNHHVQRHTGAESDNGATQDRTSKIISRSDSCSNSSSSTDRQSDADEQSKDDESKEDREETRFNHTRRKKKGGKAKGTLETSVEIRNRMIGMSEAGLSTLSIALAINRSERTVKRWLERWNKEGNVRTKERKGRRRITTKEQDDAIIAMATQHPLTAAKHVAPALGLNCSVDTIRERLHKAGIHSWKLGKKQGEGNAIHTVHLWQPSGNRPNKPKLPSEKRKKFTSVKKRVTSSNSASKKPQQKQKVSEPDESKIVPPAPPMISAPPTMQFHDTGPCPEMMQPVHNIPVSPLVSSPPEPQVPPSVAQTMQVMGPIMQQRPDCRLANTALPPEQANSSVVYPSCMVNTGNNHPPHMDQPDPLNYEPYIWSF